MEKKINKIIIEKVLRDNKKLTDSEKKEAGIEVIRSLVWKK